MIPHLKSQIKYSKLSQLNPYQKEYQAKLALADAAWATLKALLAPNMTLEQLYTTKEYEVWHQASLEVHHYMQAHRQQIE